VECAAAERLHFANYATGTPHAAISFPRDSQSTAAADDAPGEEKNTQLSLNYITISFHFPTSQFFACRFYRARINSSRNEAREIIRGRSAYVCCMRDAHTHSLIFICRVCRESRRLEIFSRVCFEIYTHTAAALSVRLPKCWRALLSLFFPIIAVLE
jgi:hypothetical protein